LPPALLAGYHSAGDRWLVQVFAKSNVWDIDPLKEFARQVASVDPNISGKPISTLHALVAMTDGYWQSAWLAAIVIALAVWFDFRHLGHTLLALLPLVVGCIASMGTMGLCGISFNPANMIALPLVLGIGVDYGVHVLHDYRNSLAGGSNGYRMTRRLGRALFLTSSTTLLSFAALIVARHQGMHSIGLVLAIGVGWCTAAAMLLLPAVLQWMEQPAEQPATIPMPLSDNIYSKSA
jgi:predicted RND superfamily exporter protein